VKPFQFEETTLLKPYRFFIAPNGNQVFRTNIFSYHPFLYQLDTRSYHIVYMFVPHKHIFEIAQLASPNLSYLTDCCHKIITCWPLRSFSVIGDVYLTLFALKSPKTLLGIKRIVSFLKIFS